MIKLKKILSITILFTILMNSVFAQMEYNSMLSLPKRLQGEETIDISTPKISEWYQSCKSAEDIKNKSDWGYCNGYLDAAIQSHYATTKRKCPNFSIQEVLNAVDEEASVYQENHSKPAKGKDGSIIKGVRVYQPNIVAEWERPAFSVLSSILKQKCTL